MATLLFGKPPQRFPQEVVAEAIVNAVVHRGYTSNASVQVMLFKDGNVVERGIRKEHCQSGVSPLSASGVLQAVAGCVPDSERVAH
jgi:hypothetical protein